MTDEKVKRTHEEIAKQVASIIGYQPTYRAIVDEVKQALDLLASEKDAEIAKLNAERSIIDPHYRELQREVEKIEKLEAEIMYLKDELKNANESCDYERDRFKKRGEELDSKDEKISELAQAVAKNALTDSNHLDVIRGSIETLEIIRKYILQAPYEEVLSSLTALKKEFNL